MPDIKDTQQNYQGLNSAVMDVLQKNQDLYRQDMEAQFAKYMIAPEEPAPQPTEAEMDAVTQRNVVDTPPAVSDVEEIDSETVIAGSSGVASEE